LFLRYLALILIRASPIAQVTYYELRAGLTRCSLGSVSQTNFGPSCSPCPLGTYATSFSQTQCVPCPTGQITPMPGATSAAQCASLFCPFVSTGPDPLGSSFDLIRLSSCLLQAIAPVHFSRTAPVPLARLAPIMSRSSMLLAPPATAQPVCCSIDLASSFHLRRSDLVPNPELPLHSDTQCIVVLQQDLQHHLQCQQQRHQRSDQSLPRFNEPWLHYLRICYHSEHTEYRILRLDHPFSLTAS
jgi:hypothetical protein